MEEPQEAPPRVQVLKQDEFGRVELLPVLASGQRVQAIRRVAIRGTLWAPVARRLLARERRALARLEGLEGVTHEWREVQPIAPLPPLPAGKGVLYRAFVRGVPLHRANELPLDFFDQLDLLVQALHERGVCHNDLHKEQNILVGDDGYPWLVDFQLASVHEREGRVFRSRVRDDLRHVQKHRRRYTRDGRGPTEISRGAGFGLERRGAARFWKRRVKPLWKGLAARGLLQRWFGKAESEERRASSDPFPSFGPAAGPRAQKLDGSRPAVDRAPDERRVNGP
ncbi:MAG: hypothetical protein AAF368_05195 [Planctomycetota bacterium]